MGSPRQEHDATMKRALVVGFTGAGLTSMYWPPAGVSPGEGLIACAIFIVGAGILWFMPPAH